MTYRQIAKIANVSVSTVSKALSGSKEIRSELAEEIRRIAFEQGYFDEKKRRKASYISSATIAVICPEIISIFYSQIVTELKREVEARDGHIAVYVSDFDTEKLREIVKMLTMRGEADGIITFSYDDIFNEIAIPVVHISGSSSEPCDTISSDTNKIFLDIIEYLKKLGHTKIGFIGESHTKSGQEAFKRALLQSGLSVNDCYVYVVKKRFEAIGYEAAEKIIKSDDRPTAVIGAYDEVALATVHELTQNGIDVPEDISVVGINDIPASSYTSIPLTTVHIYYEEQCRMAVNLLYEKIFDLSSAVSHVKVMHKLEIRATTGKCKENSNGK